MSRMIKKRNEEPDRAGETFSDDAPESRLKFRGALSARRVLDLDGEKYQAARIQIQIISYIHSRLFRPAPTPHAPLTLPSSPTASGGIGLKDRPPAECTRHPPTPIIIISRLARPVCSFCKLKVPAPAGRVVRLPSKSKKRQKRRVASVGELGILSGLGGKERSCQNESVGGR